VEWLSLSLCLQPAGGWEKEEPGACFIARPLPMAGHRANRAGTTGRAPYPPDDGPKCTAPRIDQGRDRFLAAPHPCRSQPKRKTPPLSRRAASSHCIQTIERNADPPNAGGAGFTLFGLAADGLTPLPIHGERRYSELSRLELLIRFFRGIPAFSTL